MKGMQNAADAMNDFRLTAFGDEPSQRFKPIHSLKIHQGKPPFSERVSLRNIETGKLSS